MDIAEHLLLDRRSHVLIRAGRSKWVRVGKKRLLTLQLGLMTGMEFLENLMFVFGSRHVMTGLGVEPRNFAIVQAAYATGSMLMIGAQQRLAMRFGYRRYLSAAISVFLVATVLGARSETLRELAVARFFQGVGGGALFTSSRILVNLLFPEAERPRTQRWFVVSIFVATALAPLLASALLSYFSWRSLLYGVVPFAVVALVGSLVLLPNAEPRAREAHGVLPFVSFAGGIIALQFVLSQLRFDLFAHPLRLLSLGFLGTAGFVGFLVHQWHHPAPWVRLKPLRNGAFLTGLGAYFVYYLLASFMGYLFPIYSEKALGFTVFSTGALSSFSGLVGLVSIVLYLHYADGMPRKKPLMVAGALALTFAALWFALISPHASVPTVMVGLTVKGLFGVLLGLPIATLTFRELRDEHFAHGYQTKNLMRQLAISFSTALAAVALDNREVAVKKEMLGDLGAEGATFFSLLEQRALIAASHDMFLLLAALGMATAAALLMQRRLP